MVMVVVLLLVVVAFVLEIRMTKDLMCSRFSSKNCEVVTVVVIVVAILVVEWY